MTYILHVLRSHFFGILVLVFVFTSLSISNAHASIVNIAGNTPVGTTVFLSTGTYTTTPIGIADGGAYDAWNNHLDTGAWLIDYSITSSEVNIVHNGGTNGAYATALEALAAGTPETFTLTFDQDVKFWVQDLLNYSDNIGGVSLNLTTIPIPAALPLLLSGLAGLGLIGRKRKTLITTNNELLN